ncbi:MAG: hypothetical protein ACQEQY_00560 [Halobacteriota archaeon]
MSRHDRLRSVQHADHADGRRPSPPPAHSLALAAAIPVAAVALLSPVGPALLAAMAVSVVLVAVAR